MPSFIVSQNIVTNNISLVKSFVANFHPIPGNFTIRDKIGTACDSFAPFCFIRAMMQSPRSVTQMLIKNRRLFP